MKRMRFSPLHAVALSFALSVLGTNFSAAKEFKYATFTPPKSDVPRLAVPPFAKYVTEKTNGAITWRIFAGGSLLGARATLDGIRDGIADGGFIVPTFQISALPHVNLVPDLIAFAEDPVQAAGAGNETHILDCPECVEDYAKMNAINFGSFGTSSYWLQCAKPIAGLADLSNRKIRVTGSSAGRWVSALGATPVAIPPTEIAPAMQRGQVDCAIAIPYWLRGFSLKDSVRHIIDDPQGSFHGHGIFVFNRKMWDGLTREQKAIYLRGVAKGVANATIQGALFDEPKVVDDAVKKQHIEIKHGDAEFKAAWAKHKAGEVAAVLAGAEKRGIKKEVAERVVKAHIANLEKWMEISKKVGKDKAKFEQALWDEIYSKVKY